jgi:hypothetical protein
MRTGWDDPEYIPRWIQAPKLVVLADGRIGFAEDVGPDGPYWAAAQRRETGSAGAAHSATDNKLRVRSGNARIELKRWEPRHIEVSVSATDASVIEAGQFFYPNWSARIVGGAGLLPVIPSEPAGLITVSVPPGEYVVNIVLERDWAELLGLFLSASAAAVVMLLLISPFLLKYLANRRRAPTGALAGRPAAACRTIISLPSESE